MPLLGTRGAASARGFGFLSLGKSFWIATLGGASNDNGYGIAVDSAGNCYVTGDDLTTNPGSIEMLITKYDKSGVIQWQRVLGGVNNDRGYGIAVDSSGNCYVTGLTASAGAGNSDVLITKYNASGTIQWQRVLGGASVDYGYSIAVDGSGNCYVTGITTSAGAGNEDLLIAKYDTSGTIQWQRVLGGTSSDYGQGIAVDSS
ncbi:MAG: SBBP repeat-containing protein, partial [Roseomonas sp.]|nr:SBBP repeat-containing protein [Roseomonas sp.]